MVMKMPMITDLGITQTIPNNAKVNDHTSVAKGQWSSRWSIDYPLLLHMQHQSTINRYLFRKLSIVNIIPNATVHTKYDTFCVTLVIHILFQGKGISVEPRTPKGIIEWLNLKHTPFFWHPLRLGLHPFKKANYHRATQKRRFQFPILIRLDDMRNPVVNCTLRSAGYLRCHWGLVHH